MERKKIVKQELHPAEVIINELQACNEFRLGGTSRVHVLKKFKGQTRSVNEWASVLHKERILNF
jgi:hypothetical protein